jgi:hypothetical protein
MHTNWATALNALDPSATWVIDRKPGCYWYVRSEGGTGNTYGPMIIEGPGRWIPDSRWVLYPAQDVIEDRYTRVYNQDCDGTVSVSWLDAAGAPTDPPAGELERCSTGCCPNDDGGGKPTQPDPWQDSEVLVLCDVADDGQRTVFLRRLHYTDAEHPRIVDTLLDGTTLYEPAGQVGQCDCTSHLVEQCRCDDVNGDGSSIVRYVELLAVDGCTGELTSLGIFTEDLSGPYEPANPVPCEPAGAPAVTGVQARRVELVPGASWSAADHPTLQSVTAVAHGGAGTITTADGPSTLHAGEAVSWGVGRDSDAFLVGPLSITAGTGTIALAFTIGVTL